MERVFSNSDASPSAVGVLTFNRALRVFRQGRHGITKINDKILVRTGEVGGQGIHVQFNETWRDDAKL